MSTGEDWLFRPVAAGMIRGESLLDGTVDLEFVASLNEYLDVQTINRQRVDKVTKNGR